MRAYSEINDFEAQMVRHHLLVVKFWLAITKDEQLRRFEDRQKTGFKSFKITEEDWRNREKWEQYEQAVCDMVDRTSTLLAPWTLVEANDKNFARIKVLKTLCDRIEAKLEGIGRRGCRLSGQTQETSLMPPPVSVRCSSALNSRARKPIGQHRRGTASIGIKRMNPGLGIDRTGAMWLGTIDGQWRQHLCP